MKRLSGAISDRLRRMFAADDPGWNPGRGSTEGTKAKPKGVDGYQVGGRPGRKGRKK